MSNKIDSILLSFVCLFFLLVVFPVNASTEIDQAKTNVISLIKASNYAQAKVQTQELIADFSRNPDLPETIYKIAEEFRWSTRPDKEKYEYARIFYQQIIQSYPDSAYADKAALGISRGKVLSLIISQDFDAAGKALNEMITDFASHPNLPDELYGIAKGYGYWERHEEEKSIYQQIIQNYPNSKYADRARLGFARANVQSLIISQEYDEAQAALDKLIVDFSKNPNLHEALYWIAERYIWLNKFEDAINICQQIINNYPDSSWAMKARLSLSKARTLSLVASQDYKNAEIALDEMIIDTNDNPDLPKAVIGVVEQYYKQANQRKQKMGLDEQAIEGFRRTKVLAEEIIEDFNECDWVIPEAHLYLAYCDYQLGQYDKAAYRSKKVAKDWPGYTYAHYAQLLTAGSYGRLANSGITSRLEANSQIEQALIAVLKKDTEVDRRSIVRASLELGRLYSSTGNYADAARYFEQAWEDCESKQLPKIVYEIGKNYEKMGKIDLAADVYEEFTTIMDDPYNPDVQNIKAKLDKLR